MTPEGRLFVSDFAGGVRETFEFTPDLTLVRRFPHPVVVEVAPTQLTAGVTYDADNGTLWWTNVEVDGLVTRRVLLLEGTLDGIATGRRIELPLTQVSFPKGASYDQTTGRFHYRTLPFLWAIDTSGVVVPGYPTALEAYPPDSFLLGNITQTLAEEGSGPEGVRIEIPVAPVEQRWDRVVVTDRYGRDLGLGETPMDEVRQIDGDATVNGGGVRSVVDPNGIMYVSFISFGPIGIAVVRPVPLPPTWLRISTWQGTIGAGESMDITLTFRAGQRETGEYRSTLVVEDTAGVVLVSVPLTMVVEAGTPAEPEPEAAGVTLAVAPNPVTGAGTVTLTLARPAAGVRVTVHDVLGRVVETRHVASLPSGTTRLSLDTAGLPAGVYLVRAAGAGFSTATRFSVVR
jgi:hypothetical protein